MAFDAHKNLAISTVTQAPSPATSGAFLAVTAGEAARFPAPPFNATVWPASQPPTPGNAELVRVTAIAGDTLTITRAVESSTARSIVAGDLIAATITAKVITDIESGTKFPQIVTGPIQGSVGSFYEVVDAHNFTIDNGSNGSLSYTRLILSAGGLSHSIFACAPGFAQAPPNYPGGVTVQTNGAGGLSLVTNHASGAIRFHVGNGTERGRMHPGGGFSWGGTTDPGDGFIVGGPYGAGNVFSWVRSGDVRIGGAGTASTTLMIFLNANGGVGNITTAGTATAFNTTSDARLKTDRGLITDPEVLRSTRVHHFTWNTDGTAGRGVFAQEAIAVLPSAVSIGTDERDENGNLKHPWGVDYSKYVPDLIAGWQHHDRTLEQMAARLTAVEAATIGTSTPPHYETGCPPPPPPNDYVRRGMGGFWQWITAWVRRPSWV